MALPFPGMDPYLEGYLWPDVHSTLAGRIRKQLAIQLRPRYIARLEVYTVTVNVEIRLACNHQLITSVKLLSPIDKREPGLKVYQERRERLGAEGVHLLEIDLLRQGSRALNQARLPATPYLITLTRSSSDATDTWPLTLQERLPVLPVPLHAPDVDGALDLQAAFEEAYAEAAYDLSINYQEAPPPPALSAADAAWVRKRLGQ